MSQQNTETIYHRNFPGYGVPIFPVFEQQQQQHYSRNQVPYSQTFWRKFSNEIVSFMSNYLPNNKHERFSLYNRINCMDIIKPQKTAENRRKPHFLFCGFKFENFQNRKLLQPHKNEPHKLLKPLWLHKTELHTFQNLTCLPTR